MTRKLRAAVLALSLLSVLPAVARADNQMGYRLLSVQEASGLDNQHGALGLDVSGGQPITSSGLTFELMRIKGVRSGSPGARAGLKAGDQIIAIDGQVFQSIRAFAAYVGSRSPGQQVSLDYIPRGGGPAQAERIPLTVGSGQRGAVAQDQSQQPSPNQQQAGSGGMSTRTKIGIAAAALFGCYELGCFSHRQQPAPQR